MADEGLPVEDRQPDTAPPQRPVRDRQVVLAAAGVVALVLGLLALSAYVPAVGQALSGAPLLIVALVVVTAVVLLRAIRPRT